MNSTAYFLLVTLVLPPGAAADQLALGVVEQPQCKDNLSASARLLFVRSDNRWESLNNERASATIHDPTTLSWSVAFNGRKLGNLTLRNPNPSNPSANVWYYGRDALYEVDNVETIPKVINESNSFVGWCKAPDVRPLVLVSKPNFKDPENWKQFVPGQSHKERLYAPFKLVVGRFNAIRCAGEGELTQPWIFTVDDLVMYAAYHSANGKELVSIGFDPTKIGCDFVGDSTWSNHWFLLNGEETDFLGTEMELVDFGDYDDDGRTELLFWFSGYNKDGYVLIYDELRQKTEYLWSYH